MYPLTHIGPTSPLEFQSSLTATFKCVRISCGGKGKGKGEGVGKGKGKDKGKGKGKGKGEVTTNHSKRQKLAPHVDSSS